MRSRMLLVASGCCALGIFIDLQINRAAQSVPSVETGGGQAPPASMPRVDVRSPDAESARQREDHGESPSLVAAIESRPAPAVDGAAQAFFAAAEEKALEQARERYTNELLVGGFSPQRIEWINQRSAELRVEVERGIEERRYSSGMAMAYVADPDLDLRNEIGEEEYDRYRQALGRPAGVEIDRVLPDSIAETAGLRSGDQVVAYSGKRVYNNAMLKLEIAADGSGSAAVVDVLRGGQRVQLVVPPAVLAGQEAASIEAAVRARKAALALQSP